ncbi:MAG TPA: isomerizing glutamine--fructose-6-phosphate transaminase [Terriglobales bacterium]|jgi:glucosamine--fructose-6-phosphate aminotransferase (isomerizing)|nr:isomerizing glutamine--fructose-6-phosphate transaminase [Terriglobales bacterium]
MEHPKPGAVAGFPHHMLREIYEQPEAVAETIRRHVDRDRIFRGELEAIGSALAACKRMIIAASGSSRHAGLAGEIMIEDLSDMAVDVEYASEYCYRSTQAAADSIVMVITQSGETADTIAALRAALTRGASTIAISNVAESTIAREANVSLLSYAGPELAVPATKSFTTQLTVLFLFALFLAEQRGRISTNDVHRHVSQLRDLSRALRERIPSWDAQCLACARQHSAERTFLYLGRGIHYAIAREGALKLKEISYIHGEGYPAGELKHGPSALIDSQSPVVVLATCDHDDPDSVLRYRKTLGVMKDVKQEGGKVIAVATEGDSQVLQVADQAIFVPATTELLSAILEVVPLQLFAYHVAVLNGCDVDHPRHLVKAVVRE